MAYANEELAPDTPFLGNRLTPDQKEKVMLIVLFFFIIILFGGLFYIVHRAQQDWDEEEERIRNYVPDIIIPSMDFTVLNLTVTRRSVKWDLVIRIPYDLPGYYTCLKGSFQTFILYKGVTIAKTSLSYNLIPYWPQLLNTSSVAFEGDMDSVVVKDIMEDIKERRDMRFGTQLLFPDCRSGRTMNYTCDETALRFEPGSQRKAATFGKTSPVCHYIRP